MKSVLNLRVILALGIGCMALAAAPAGAESVLVWESDFQNVTTETGLSGSYFDVQVWWDAAAPDQAVFRFFNNGTGTPDTGVITDIYWGESSPNILYFDDSAFVLPDNWNTPASPPAFPGEVPRGGTFDLVASADSNPPVVPNGIDWGDWLDFTVGLDSTGYADGETALRDRLEAGDIRLGLHVQSIGQGSDWFYAPPVPVPSAAGIGLVGIGMVLVMQLYKRRLHKG